MTLRARVAAERSCCGPLIPTTGLFVLDIRNLSLTLCKQCYTILNFLETFPDESVTLLLHIPTVSDLNINNERSCEFSKKKNYLGLYVT